MTPERKILTLEQQSIVHDYVESHGLDASQISFEGHDTKPIFDYEAVNALSLKVTDIKDIECEISERDFESEIVTARCIVTLPDGRTRTSEDSARVGDPYGDRKIVDSIRLAEQLAQTRAVRRGVRSVGINLHRAHEQWKKNGGQPVSGHTDYNPRKPLYDEVHLYAEKAGYIVNGDTDEYRKFIAETYDGRTSAKDLDDIELRRLIVTFRSFARLKDVARKQAA